MGLKGFLKRFFNNGVKSNLVRIYLEDAKCNRKIQVLLRKSYDIQRLFEEDREADYIVNKVVICDRCFHKIKFKIRFDRSYRTVSREIEGGRFLTAEEFQESSTERKS